MRYTSLGIWTPYFSSPFFKPAPPNVENGQRRRKRMRSRAGVAHAQQPASVGSARRTRGPEVLCPRAGLLPMAAFTGRVCLGGEAGMGQGRLPAVPGGDRGGAGGKDPVSPPCSRPLGRSPPTGLGEGAGSVPEALCFGSAARGLEDCWVLGCPRAWRRWARTEE